MEAPQSLFWSIPSEIIVSIFSLLPFRSIINFETADKTQSKQFNERDLYKQLTCNLFHWGPNDVKSAEQFSSEKINWRAEFIISSIHHNKILTNELKYNDVVDEQKIKKLMPQLSPNHFRVSLHPTSFASRFPYGIVYILMNKIAYIEATNLSFEQVFQSKFPLYPHPLADFTVAYYETSLIAKRSPIADHRFAVGAALDGYQAFVGVGRNSFSYGDKGIVLLELDVAPIDQPVFNPGDTVGFGIDFQSRAVFWTLNGQLVCSRTHNYWHEPLLNLDTLHAVVSCHQGFEFSLNFGSSPFVFDIIKYQHDNEAKAKKDTMSSLSSSHNKETYSLKMLRTMLKYIEEETVAAIDRGKMSPWSVCDCNAPKEEPKTYIPPLWAMLAYPQGDFVHLRMFETLSMHWELLKQWKDNENIKTNLIEFARAIDMSASQANENIEELIMKLQTTASIAIAGVTARLLETYDQHIRNDVAVYMNIVPTWTQIARAYKFLVPTDLPLEHHLIQSLLYYVSFCFQLNLNLPIKQEMVPDLMLLCQQYLMSLRLQAIRLIILDKNEQKKEEFEKRNAWLKDLYQKRISNELLEAMMANSDIPRAPGPVTDKDREALHEGMQATNMIRLDHYDSLSDISKSCTKLEVMSLAHFSTDQLDSESEEVMVKEAKKQIRKMMDKDKYITGLERLKSSLKIAEPNEVVDLAMLYGLDVTIVSDKLITQLTRCIEETINKVKKEKEKKNKKNKKKSKTQEQSSMTTQLLLGAGLGLLIGLGAAFIVHRYKSK